MQQQQQQCKQQFVNNNAKGLPVDAVLFLGHMPLVEYMSGRSSTESKEEARNSGKKHCRLQTACETAVCVKHHGWPGPYSIK